MKFHNAIGIDGTSLPVATDYASFGAWHLGGFGVREVYPAARLDARSERAAGPVLTGVAPVSVPAFGPMQKQPWVPLCPHARCD
jgi:hypothetical protein